MVRLNKKGKKNVTVPIMQIILKGFTKCDSRNAITIYVNKS